MQPDFIVSIIIVGSIFLITPTGKNAENYQHSYKIEQKENAVSGRNTQVVDTVIEYGPSISSTYKKAVCTELVIQILEKFHSLTKTDKRRIRIIINDNIQTLLKNNSPLPKGVCYALTMNGKGIPIEKIEEVLPGDFVQFWTDSWGHCGIVKDIDISDMTMELYSSFPSTDGYGVQKFKIPAYCFFVRMK